MNKILIGLGTLISTVSLGVNANQSAADTQTNTNSDTPNVRVLNNNTVSPTSSTPKSVNTVNTNSKNDVNVKEDNNSTSNIPKNSSEHRSTATSTVSVNLIRAVVTSRPNASYSLAKQLNDSTDYNRQISNDNNGDVIYNPDGTGYYLVTVSNSGENQVNGTYSVYQNGYIAKNS
ncbi:hypothetical protein R4Y45_06800 [Holzapfeliella sp. He02]|uniref:Uncharacterized protein n=1 Tax=Holzapfeliella saturejae TaxID=3082953 RepID=A0ABU8SHQ7_9LACO